MTHPTFTPCPFPMPPIDPKHTLMWDWYLAQAQEIHTIAPYAAWVWELLPWTPIEDSTANRSIAYRGTVPGSKYIIRLVFVYADHWHPETMIAPEIDLSRSLNYADPVGSWEYGSKDGVGCVRPCSWSSVSAAITLREYIDRASKTGPIIINKTVPFSHLAIGAKFRYLPDTDEKKVFVKIGPNTIAQWNNKMVHDRWIGQLIFCFSDQHPEVPNVLDDHVFPLDNPDA